MEIELDFRAKEKHVMSKYINHNGEPDPDIADLIFMVSYMFQEGPEPPCKEEADINGDGLAEPDIADLIALVSFMFQNGTSPTQCL